ncbi:MAG: NADH-quinone oxidoreductase subunit NuoF [Tissierellales bacterium]|nr:NADH-quinone oxidoreductase subunit NuoF [Tissierellales bacterium]
MSEQCKLSGLDDLIRIKSDFEEKQSKYRYKILVCSGGGCVSSNCKEVMESLLSNIKEKNLENTVTVSQTGCIGTCDLGPVMVVLPEGIFYTQLNADDVSNIVDRHLIQGHIVEEKTYFDKIKQTFVPYIDEIDFFKRQVKLTLQNCGSVDYSSLDEYIANDGFFGAAKAMIEMTPQEVVETIKISGLRGRGGGGFPTGIKWEAGRVAEGPLKYLICNADEGDPGAFMDRSLLEGDPYGVIEGMLIGGYAIGASKGYVYVRAEYPIAIERLDEAIRHSREAGILGQNIFNSGVNFDIEIRIGAGAFVCGEETALMESIEGQRGEPRQKPPFPFQRGLFGKPTIINNVETFSNIPQIIRNGGQWFSEYGTSNNTGTKVFALAGAINNTGIVEVPMGTTLGDIIFDIGGGIPKRKKFKAAQTGGPSGGCVTSENLNTPMDYDSLKKLGAIMGSGGLISMDEDTCMVDMARFFMEFVQEESCGKCLPCRVGTKRMLEILERITKGEGKEGDIELLEELGETISQTAICGLGQTAPNPVLSMIRNFREEYEEHIKYKYCRAGVCADLFISPCENACPAGVNVPGYMALISVGRFREAYQLIRKDNPFPAICGRVCTHPCESKCRRGQLDEPVSISDLKRYVSDYVMNHEEPYMDLVFPKKNKSIGIIGAGPSGLTCGYYLARLGYHVEIFEAQPVSGGVLAFGIPEYRLPNHILEYEINLIKQTGVIIHNQVEVGKDISFEELSNRFDAVYIATGTQFSKRINIPGEDLMGVYHGLDFLRDVNLKNKKSVSGKVVVIGGGNTAIDASRTAMRLGAEKVTILYRRTIEDMPADRREIQEALEEGIEIRTLVMPVAFNGKIKVESVQCREMQLGKFDASGRRKSVPIEGTEYLIEADVVIPAVSQFSDLPFVDREEAGVNEWGTFATDRDTFMTKMEGVFAGGDVARGSDTAITAIADGKNAAKSIDIYLGGKGVLNTGEEIEIPLPSDEKEIMEHERFPMKFLDAKDRKNNFDEVSLGFHKLNAIAESMRCLRCDRRA